MTKQSTPLDGRKVLWRVLVQSHDLKTHYYRIATGLVLSSCWSGDDIWCIVYEKDGRLYKLRATDLTLADNPLATTQSIQKQ